MNPKQKLVLERISRLVLKVCSTAFRWNCTAFRLKPGQRTWVLKCAPIFVFAFALSIDAGPIFSQDEPVYGNANRAKDSAWILGWWNIDLAATYQANKEDGPEDLERLMHNLTIYSMGLDKTTIELFMFMPGKGTWELTANENDDGFKLAIEVEGTSMPLAVEKISDSELVMQPPEVGLKMVMKKMETTTQDAEEIEEVCGQLKAKWQANADQTFELCQTYGLSPSRDQIDQMFAKMAFEFTGTAMNVLGPNEEVINEIQWVPTLCETRTAGDAKSYFLLANSTLRGRKQPISWEANDDQLVVTLGGIPIAFDRVR